MVKIVIQPHLVSSLIVTTLLCILFVWVGKQIEKTDPLKKPGLVVAAVEMVVEIIQNFFHSILNDNKLERKYTPYFTCIAVYILVSNIFGLLGFEAPTSNFSITLSLALITFTFIQLTALKTKGAFTYLKDIVWPPTNIFSTIAPLISLSMRLFGNIVSGGVVMTLVYAATELASSWLFGFIPFNIVGPMIAPILHCYFDIWSGALQTFIFVTLSNVYIKLES